MEFLRTPDECFDDLENYEFEPNYCMVPDGEGGELRMHYVDEGPQSGEIVLCLHGEPSWSYLYRKMIPIFTGAEYRSVAPDLVGFGRSDKPAHRENYSYANHMAWLTSFILELDLRNITLVCQDWGGLLGLRLAAEQPDRFSRIVAANTMLPTGDNSPGEAFLAWQKFSQETPEFKVGNIVNGGCVSELSDEVVAAYNAPFPDERFKEGARQFPLLVPTSPDDPAAPANRAAWDVLQEWDKPFLCAFSDSDTISRHLPQLRQAAIAESHRLIDHIQSLDDEALNAGFDYETLGGTKHQQLRRESLAHLLNHQTHHRSQATTCFSLLGETPPALDLLVYQRSL